MTAGVGVAQPMADLAATQSTKSNSMVLTMRILLRKDVVTYPPASSWPSSPNISAVFANTKTAGAPNPDGYVYVYAISGELKKVSVARVKSKDFENFSKWKYWDGTTWEADISKAVKIADRASNELSVSPLPDGRYAMVFQTDGLGNSVGMRLGATPYGPFGPIIKIWDCTEQQQAKNFIVYNAKAHPALSKPGELIITYNVGSFDFWNDVKDHSNFYRPRFIRLKLQ